MKLEITKTWCQGQKRFREGFYRVPFDIPIDLAEKIISSNSGLWIDKKLSPPKKQNKWKDQTVIVAASGPSLNEEYAEKCKGYPTIAVNDAWRLLPWADVLYACDIAWWKFYKGVPEFKGEKWVSDAFLDKDYVKQFGLNVIPGKHGDMFSYEPSHIHFGSNSGFQAVNLAILWGAKRIILIGFNMKTVNGKKHFFGDHPSPLRNAASYTRFIKAFENASKTLPDYIEIINATPDSALKCFPIMDLENALQK